MAEPDHLYLRPIPNLMKGRRPAAFPFFYINPKAREVIEKKHSSDVVPPPPPPPVCMRGLLRTSTQPTLSCSSSFARLYENPP
jgi:hypothetical protein